MSTKIPITIEGNLTADPEFGESNGTKYARFDVAVTDRRFDEATDTWSDGSTKFHKVTAFGRTAENVRDSLAKGDRAIVVGDLEFREWRDKETDEPRQGTQVTASAVGPSLKFHTATVNRAEAVAAGPKADGPDVSATGPVAQPAGASAPGLAR